MRTYITEAKVGLFIILALITLLFMTFRIAKINLFENNDGYIIYIYFDSITGVEKKSKVTMAGVKIGRVTDIELDNAKAKIVVRIDYGVTVKRDSVAIIKSKGLLGEKYIELTGGSEDSLPINHGDIITKTVKPMDIDETMGKVNSVLADIKEMTASFSNVFGGKDGEMGIRDIFDQIKELSHNLNNVSANLNSTIKITRKDIKKVMHNIIDLTKIMKDIVVSNRNDIDRIVKNIEGLTGETKKSVPMLITDLDKVVLNAEELLKENRGNLKEFIGNMKLASRQLGDTLDSIKEIAGKIEQGKGTVGKLVSDEKVYEKIDSTLEGINKFVTRAEKLRIGVGFRAEYQADEGENKGYFTLKLQPREDRYYLLEASRDIRKSTAKTDKNALNNLLYTVEFHKRYTSIDISIGLTESSFGLGADYYALDNRLRLGFDIFNFSGYDSTVDYPQLKISSEFKFYRHLFVNTGIDELFNKKYRSFFIGGGIIFTDDDLKTILGKLL